MRLTKKKAIKIATELWTWLAKTGVAYKDDWSEWEQYGAMDNDCPLCEYSLRKDANNPCIYCPYCLKFGGCCTPPSPYDNWDIAGTKTERQKYAKEFLEQLKQL